MRYDGGMLRFLIFIAVMTVLFALSTSWAFACSKLFGPAAPLPSLFGGFAIGWFGMDIHTKLGKAKTEAKSE